MDINYTQLRHTDQNITRTKLNDFPPPTIMQEEGERESGRGIEREGREVSQVQKEEEDEDGRQSKEGEWRVENTFTFSPLSCNLLFLPLSSPPPFPLSGTLHTLQFLPLSLLNASLLQSSLPSYSLTHFFLQLQPPSPNLSSTSRLPDPHSPPPYHYTSPLPHAFHYAPSSPLASFISIQPLSLSLNK